MTASDREHHHRRREMWGDDPEEIEASKTIEEFAQDAEVQRAGRDHPASVPFKVVARFIMHNGKRVGITIVGFAVLLAGVALLVLPGPGWLLIFIGLGILSTEYVWARRLLNTAKKKAEQAKNAVLRRKSENGNDETT